MLRAKYMSLLALWNLSGVYSNLIDRMYETESHANYRSVMDCIVEIYRSSHHWRRTVVLKDEKQQSEVEKQFVRDMATRLNHEMIPYVSTKDFKLNKASSKYTVATFVVISFYENCNRFHDSLPNLNEYVKYLVVIDSCTTYLHGYDPTIDKYYDISLFLKTKDDAYKLITQVPQKDPTTCTTTVNSIMINSCNSGKLLANKKEIFPHKNPINLNKCPVKVGIGSLYPFAMIKNKETLKTYDRIDLNEVKGVDVEIIKIILQTYFNASLDLYYVLKSEENPRNTMEFVKFVQNGSLEICAGGLGRIYGENVEYSNTYATQTMFWVYYVERTYRTLQNLITSLDRIYLFIIFYFTYIVAWQLVCKFDKQAVSLIDTLFYSWGALIGSAALSDARTVKQKILNIVYILMSLHLSIYTSIQLYSFYTIFKPIDIYNSNEAAMNSGRIPYLHPEAKYLIDDENYIRFASSSLDCNSFRDCLGQSLKHKGMTVILGAAGKSFLADTAVNGEARMMKPDENLLTLYYKMVFHKGLPLAEDFRIVIRRLFENGIIIKLFRDIMGLNKQQKFNSILQNARANSYSCQAGCKLSMQQLGGIFYVLVIGWVVSFVVFILEIIVKKLR